jgi:hypothetical protein
MKSYYEFKALSKSSAGEIWAEVLVNGNLGENRSHLTHSILEWHGNRRSLFLPDRKEVFKLQGRKEKRLNKKL